MNRRSPQATRVSAHRQHLAAHRPRVVRPTAHRRHVARATDKAGFSLLEVAIAAGVLLLTVAAASGFVMTVLKSDALTHDRDTAATDVQNWLGTVRTLPMMSDQLGGETNSVLGRLFPHADITRNTAAAAYIASAAPDAPAGAFLTRLDLPSCALRVTARFAICSGGEWLPLPPTAVAGWQAPDLRPPSLSLILDLTYYRDGDSAPRRLSAVVTNSVSDDRVTVLP